MLKRIFLFVFIMASGLLFFCCGTSRSAVAQDDVSREIVSGKQTSEGGKTLVVYFTWSGNSAIMANYIQKQTGADILALQPVNAYPAQYDECVEVAKKEKEENIFPSIANLPDSMEQYGRILVGYPIWWHTAPMIIGTFLQSYDWTGKEVYPFVQSAAMSQEHFDNSMEFVRRYAKNAAVHDGLYARSADRAAIDQWLKENNLLK